MITECKYLKPDGSYVTTPNLVSQTGTVFDERFRVCFNVLPFMSLSEIERIYELEFNVGGLTPELLLAKARLISEIRLAIKLGKGHDNSK